MSPKNKHRNTNDYLKYLKGELSGEERHAFERGLEADPFEREAMEGLETLTTGQAEEDLPALHSRLRKRIMRRRRVAIYSVAATVASLLIVGTVFLKVHDFDPRSTEDQVYPEESFEDFAPEKTETVPSPVDEEEVSPEVQEAVSGNLPKESRSAEKGPQKEPEEAPAEAFDFEMEKPEMEMEVSRMAAPMPEAPEKEEMLEKEITYLEAEPVAQAEEALAARAEEAAAARAEEALTAKAEERVTAGARKAERKKTKSAAQPVAIHVQEIPEMAPHPKEMGEMLTGKVTGIVISAEDQGPIPGVVVVNREMNSGVYTDQEGRFGIPVQEDSQTTLVASFIGMETQEYQVKNGTHLELVMQPDAATLDEVVVVGYVSGQDMQATGSAFDLYQAEEKEGVEYTVAEPSTGFKKYRRYIKDNIRYPGGLDTKREVVVLKFTVTKKGAMEDITPLKSPGPAFTEEAIRLLTEGPPWTPASNELGPRDDMVRIRIVFSRD